MVNIKKSEGDSEGTLSTVPPKDIVAFSELRSCFDLVRLLTSDQLKIDPDFQREYVWDDLAGTKFIDSLVKQLPIPSMCFALDGNTEQRMVIDGLQRISTIKRFLSGDESWRLTKTPEVDASLSGKTVSDIKKNSVSSYRRIENATIPITVIRCDFSKSDHMEYLFTIFHRLNSGGVKLSNQEIRNCIFSGDFNDFLKTFVKYESFVKLLGIKIVKRSRRFVDEEFVLRVLALSEGYQEFAGSLPNFLNSFMFSNRKCDAARIDFFRTKLESTSDLILDKIFDGGNSKSVSKIVLECLWVGVLTNIDRLVLLPDNKIKEMYSRLIALDELSKEYIIEGSSKGVRVRARIAKAIKVFGDDVID